MKTPTYVDVTSQGQLDELLRDRPEVIPVLRSGPFLLWGDAHAVLWGDAHAVLRGNAHAELWEHATAVLWENATAEAFGASHLDAFDQAQVTAAGSGVVIHQHSESTVVTGGTQIRVLPPATVVEWCRFWGLPIADGVVVLYKAVRDDYQSSHNTRYLPGTVVEAHDWDGGVAECGGGLHFSPHPSLAIDIDFDREATRFVAAPVALEDIRCPQPGDHYPDKLKVRRCGPVFEVDRRGRRKGAEDNG